MQCNILVNRKEVLGINQGYIFGPGYILTDIWERGPRQRAPKIFGGGIK